MIAAIVLAAGASRRFGSQKLLAELHGKPIVRWAVENLLTAQPDEVIVVVGYEGDSVRAALNGLPVRFAVNERWDDGLGGSLRAGIAALTADADAAVVVLGDQPGVDAVVIATLLNAFSEGSRPIAAPSYRGERGHPVIFSAELFPELLAIEGDRGARDIIARDPSRVMLVDFDLPVPIDLDTEAELLLAAERPL
jgi:molybdenum cofactor cytidylyltransferase